MKRRLAKEALYHSDRVSVHSGTMPCDIPAMQNCSSKRIMEIDPHGDRALALLRELDTKKESHQS